jgi:hypothetical protein
VAGKRQLKEKQVMTMPELESVPRDSWPDLESLIDQKLAGLPAKYRIILLLCGLEGKTGREAARQLQIPEGTLAGRLRAGRALLARRLARHGLTFSGGALAVALSRQAVLASAPPEVVSGAIHTATLVAAGKAVPAGMVPATVAALTEGVLKSMVFPKFKIGLGVLVLLSVSLFGGGLLAQVAPPRPETELPPVASPEAKKTPEPAAGKVRVDYPVADLVVPIRGLDGQDETEAKVDWLIQRIKRTVAPQTWDDQGGAGSIQYFPKDMVLVVHNSPPVQARVNRLLETMRRAQDVQVAVETRIVTVRKDSLPKLRSLFPDLKIDGHLILNEAEVFALLEKSQAHQETSVQQLPKVTMFSGQRAKVSADTLEMDIATLVAANLRQVVLAMKAKAGAVQWAKTIRLIDGATLVLPAVSGSEEIKILLATPRVLILVEESGLQDEQKVVPAGAAAPPRKGAAQARLNEALKNYEQACEANDVAQARQWAARAIEIDPTCFQKMPRKSRTVPKQ